MRDPAVLNPSIFDGHQLADLALEYVEPKARAKSAEAVQAVALQLHRHGCIWLSHASEVLVLGAPLNLESLLQVIDIKLHHLVQYHIEQNQIYSI